MDLVVVASLIVSDFLSPHAHFKLGEKNATISIFPLKYQFHVYTEYESTYSRYVRVLHIYITSWDQEEKRNENTNLSYTDDESDRKQDLFTSDRIGELGEEDLLQKIHERSYQLFLTTTIVGE